MGATDLGFGKTGMITAAVATVLIDYFFAVKQYIHRDGIFGIRIGLHEGLLGVLDARKFFFIPNVRLEQSLSQPSYE